MIAKRAPVVLVILILFATSCTQTPPPTTPPGIQANSVRDFTFSGGTFKDGVITLGPGTKVEPGPTKNVVTLMRPNGTGLEVSCFCTLEGGDCWAVSNPIPGGSVGVGCASQNCAGGEEPFCFMDLGDVGAGFKIRLAVRSRQ